LAGAIIVAGFLVGGRYTTAPTAGQFGFFLIDQILWSSMDLLSYCARLSVR
jgi:hypothetical protein